MEETRSSDPDWSTLHKDLIISIAKHLPLENYVVFASVCRSWRSVLTKHNFKSTNRHCLPWVILFRPSLRSNPETTRVIFSLSNNKLYKLLPPLRRPPSPPVRVFSSFGWIMTAFATTNDLTLFHPLSPDRSVIPLPNWKISTVDKLLLSSTPTFPPPPDFIAVTIVVKPTNRLLYWRPGNSQWKKIETVPRDSSFVDLALLNGRFYAVDRHRRIYDLNLDRNFLDDDEHHRVATVVSHLTLPKWEAPFLNPYDVEMLFLVESEGSLLVVQGNRQWWGEGRHETMEFRVFEVDVNDGAFRKVKNLGDRALFVGDNSSSFSVKASEFEGCKCNCVYFADDLCNLDRCWVRKKDIGIFHLESGEVEHLFGFEDANSNYLAPVWVQPSFYF